MKVIERLRGAIVGSRNKFRCLYHKQPGIVLAATIFVGISVPLGLSLKTIADVVRMQVEDNTLAEAELAASKLDISISQQRLLQGTPTPPGDLPDRCTVPGGQSPDNRREHPPIELNDLQNVSVPPTGKSLVPMGITATFRDSDRGGGEQSSGDAGGVTVKVSARECFFPESLSTESLADIFQTFEGGVGAVLVFAE